MAKLDYWLNKTHREHFLRGLKATCKVDEKGRLLIGQKFTAPDGKVFKVIRRGGVGRSVDFGTYIQTTGSASVFDAYTLTVQDIASSEIWSWPYFRCI